MIKKIFLSMLVFFSINALAYHGHTYHKGWRLGGNANRFGYQIFHHGQLVDGRATHLIMHKGKPWVINRQGDIFKREHGTWEKLPGRTFHLTVSNKDRVWSIGTTLANVSGYPIYYWKNNQWNMSNGSGVRFINRPHRAVRVINRQNMVFVWRNGSWQYLRSQY